MLDDTALNTIKDLNLIPFGSSVCAAVSGGPDSMALLVFLLKHKNKLGITELSVCHFNHNLRGEESDRDERFVRDYCEKNSIKLFVEYGHMNEISVPSGESTESLARKLRYSFFEKIHGLTGSLIAIAHNMNDSAETVLFNMIRGTGISGLKGISPERDFYIRPLIKVSREEITAFCKENEISYVTDSTNLSNEYSRNILRNNVFPYLVNINSRTIDNISRISEDAGEIFSMVDTMARKLGDEASEGDHIYNSEILRKAPLPVIRQFISLTLKSHHVDVNRNYINSVLDVISGKKNSTAVGNNLEVFIYDGQTFFLEAPTEGSQPKKADIGINLINGLIFDLDMGYNNPCDFLNSVDFDKLSGDIYFRPRIPGEVFRPAVRGQTKTMKKIFQELRIPSQFRDDYRFLSDEKGIIWIPGFGICDRVKIDDSTKRYLHIKYN